MNDEQKRSNRPGARKRAEETLARSKGSSGPTQQKAVEELVHELEVHQIELEMQNEELRTAQLALEKSRSEYADLYDFAPVGYFIISRNGRITAANLTGAALLGVGRPELIHHGFGRFVAPEDADRWDRHRLDALQQEGTVSCELTLKREDDSPFYARLDSIRTGADDGAFALRTTVADISERKQAEEELRERDIRFNKLSSHVPGMIYQFMKRPDGIYCVPFTTEAIKDIFGCSPQDVRNDFSPIAKVILPEDFDKVVGSIEYSAEHLTPWQCEYRVQIPGQSLRWIFGQSTPEKLADGSVIWHGFITDISERKQLEAEVEKAQMDFLFAVSHELKTPLLVMSAAEELVELLPPEQRVERFRDYADVWKRNLIRLRTIIDNLVDSQRSPRTGMKLSPHPTDLGALVERMLEELAPLAQKKGLQLEREIDLCRLLSLDPEACARILTNLLTNAIKFSPVSGAIRIKLREEADQVVLQIVDQGSGIPADEIPNLFQPFHRGSGSVRAVVPGTGLGLYVCRILTEAQGGTIGLESTVGRGTTVTVQFPLTDGSLASNR